MDRELMQQALEAMLAFPDDISDEMFEAIRALKERLAQPEQEPVAWASKRTLDCIKDFDGTIYANGGFDDAVPLYTAPQPRQWQGLTDDEAFKILDNVLGFNTSFGLETNFVRAFVRAIEAKLREKNT